MPTDISKPNFCPQCGKNIDDVEYIRYGGVCKVCWHTNDRKRKEKTRNIKKR